MRRADRLFEIVQLLRRERRPVSAAAIAAELESSKRAIYRDMAALKARRVPITGEPGLGYVLESGFDMPPLMLAPAEVEAAVLGAQWVVTRGEPELARAAQNLLTKIETVVPARLRPHILEPSTSVAPPKAPSAETHTSARLRVAVREGRKVALRYRDSEGQVSDRIVWPVLLGYRDAGRILAAWCELRGGFRYFRTDRMETADVLDALFPERPAKLRARWRLAMDEARLSYLAPDQPASESAQAAEPAD